MITMVHEPNMHTKTPMHTCTLQAHEDSKAIPIVPQLSLASYTWAYAFRRTSQKPIEDLDYCSQCIVCYRDLLVLWVPVVFSSLLSGPWLSSREGKEEKCCVNDAHADALHRQIQCQLGWYETRGPDIGGLCNRSFTRHTIDPPHSGK